MLLTSEQREEYRKKFKRIHTKTFPLMWNGKKYKYSRICSIYYVGGEVTCYDEIEDEPISHHPVDSREEANKIMDMWIENAPSYSKAMKLAV